MERGVRDLVRLPPRRDRVHHRLAETRIEQLALYDFLTGLANQALLWDRLKQTLAAAKRRGDRVALLFLDLNRLKVINDPQGHATGDEGPLEVARRVVLHLR